jgi:hypothetical protein
MENWTYVESVMAPSGQATDDGRGDIGADTGQKASEKHISGVGLACR